MKHFFFSLCISLVLALPAQTTLLGPGVNNGGFESGATGWSFANAAQNKWYVGSFARFAGTNGCYIDANATAGTANDYANTAAVSHVYRSLSFPAGQTCITLSFKWKCNGEFPTFDADNLKVFVTNAVPVAGTAVTTGTQVGAARYNVQITWQTATIVLPAALAGTTRNLVFQWMNNSFTANNPAAAIDDIEVITQVPPVPPCVAGIAPIGLTGMCPLSTTISWQTGAPTCNNAVTYDLYFNAGATATAQALTSSTATSYVTPSLSGGTMYAWRVVPRNAVGSASNCPTYTFTTGSGGNNLPCNATTVPLGSIVSGDNTCSDITGEPASPSCWSFGDAASHTVWYKFTAPASGSVRIRTAPGTLLNTKIALYGGTCGPSLTSVACNDNAPACGSALGISELSASGLTSGATYYVRVDGNNDAVGSFAMTVVEGSAAYPVTAGQSCTAPNPICNPSVQVGDPGYQWVGFTCDDSGGNNCTGGERGSVWYKLKIQANGSLNFVIVSNDYSGTSADTDYDFVMWKTAGAGAVNCADIASSGGANAVACNYTPPGVTGLAPGGNAPAPYPSGIGGVDNAFEPSLAVVAGEEYLLLVENFSNSISGFSIDFSGTASGVIDYTPQSYVVWSGGDNTTAWTTTTNWGGCTPPLCGIDAIVSPASSYQPLITASMGTVTAKSVVIDPGATLRLGPGAVLRICENLTNNGTILADPASTILFTDDNTHTLNGTLSGSSYLGNLVISDVAGGANCTVLINSDLELRGSLTTANAGSIFNLNAKTMSLAGNLMNAAGATTFLGTAGSTILFNGTSAQLYSPNTNTALPVLTLNHVQVTHAGPGISISTTNTPDMILGTSGVLNLASGKIITPGAQEVKLMNTANTAVNTGNTSSYVEGNLRRYLAAGATGSFDFPVGHSAKGYQRANLSFGTAAAAGAIQLLGRFDAWGGAWPQPGAPGWSECMTTYNVPYLDNGYWSVDASAPSTGSYTMTLYNLNYTNAASGWSIAKSSSAAPAWVLQGSCLISPVTAVKRTGMTGFSRFATIQSLTPLPVEFLSFRGQPSDRYNQLDWTNTLEEDVDSYELQSSEDASHFRTIYTCKAIGGSAAQKHYRYHDPDYYNPITYYRLRLLSNQGKEKYSQVIAIDNQAPAETDVRVYPNPAAEQLYVRLNTREEAELKLEINDLLGRTVYATQLSSSQGRIDEAVSVSSLAEGTYLLTIRDGYRIITSKKIMICRGN